MLAKPNENMSTKLVYKNLWNPLFSQLFYPQHRQRNIKSQNLLFILRKDAPEMHPSFCWKIGTNENQTFPWAGCSPTFQFISKVRHITWRLIDPKKNPLFATKLNLHHWQRPPQCRCNPSLTTLCFSSCCRRCCYANKFSQGRVSSTSPW